jgi:hypothetical protein
LAPEDFTPVIEGRQSRRPLFASVSKIDHAGLAK